MNMQTAVKVMPAHGADQGVVERLVAYYLHDLSTYTGWPCLPDGRFSGCDQMFTDWQDGKNYLFLVHCGRELAGFAAISLDSDTREFVMQEFFLLRKFRRRGIGTLVAHSLFHRFYGCWRVDVLTANTPALSFWPKVISHFLSAQQPALDHAIDIDDGFEPCGAVRSLRFHHEVPFDFAFQELAPLTDQDLTVELARTVPGDTRRSILPAYECNLLTQRRLAGNINLRVGNTFDILMYFGHIGYGVLPEFRGRHFAERACRLLLPLARRHGLDTVWITTTPQNLASRRTCERLGARLVDTVPLPTAYEVNCGGKQDKCRYRLD